MSERYVSGLFKFLGGSVTVDERQIVDRIGPISRRYTLAEFRSARVARPPGLWPGVTVVLERVDGKDVAMLSLTLDIAPSPAQAHDKLRLIAATIDERIRAAPAPAV